MILEHEIPQGSRLYFGESAKLKRKIETVASDILYKNGYEEIVTPLFSYHQHHSIADEKELIRVNDEKNHNISLRADSTVDVVRLIQKRLGRNTKQKKWFYIQPVVSYPTNEQYQVGVESIEDENLFEMINLAGLIFKELGIAPLLQISNIKIPQLLAQMFEELSLDDFRHINIDKILSLKVEWLEKLVYLQHPKQLDTVIEIAPSEIQKELKKIKALTEKVAYENLVIAPIYYAKMLYYHELFFRVIENNEVYARGGEYRVDEQTSVGFAIYTDELIEKLGKK
ncbi:ATP phosphoribosyltransferase regulatory subunit, divergent variant [hydrothermal vent metagenome]|uniref:ATP phosphoribosyltransferase regulatory subunit, divergent variant n=1 Tax=hydrothermal vent metagenome TaxID=652676 RepID=A0A1W1C303_9ZZZZ